MTTLVFKNVHHSVTTIQKCTNTITRACVYILNTACVRYIFLLYCCDSTKCKQTLNYEIPSRFFLAQITQVTMLNCRSVHLSLISRSNHNLISLLKNPRKALKREKDPMKVSPKLRKQPDHNDELMDMFPKEFYRKTGYNTTMSNQLYLANEMIARKIAHHLTRLPDQCVPFVETNPGPGLLTGLLIDGGIKDLRLFEGREEFLTHLEVRE